MQVHRLSGDTDGFNRFLQDRNGFYTADRVWDVVDHGVFEGFTSGCSDASWPNEEERFTGHFNRCPGSCPRTAKSYNGVNLYNTLCCQRHVQDTTRTPNPKRLNPCQLEKNSLRLVCNIWVKTGRHEQAPL